MSNTPLADKLYVIAYTHGLGLRRASGKGCVGIRRIEYLGQPSIEVSIGRGYTNQAQAKAVAWATLTLAQAHELAGALNYILSGVLTCEGEGLKVKLQHKTNLHVDLDLDTDLCTVMSKGPKLRELIIQKLTEKLDQMENELPYKEIKHGSGH